MGGAAQKTEFEALIFEIGSDLYRFAAGARPSLFDARGLKGRVLTRAIENEKLRAALFRFIDALPHLESAADVASHFRGYLEGHALGGAWNRLLRLGNHALLAPVVRASVGRLARYFLVEESRSAVARALDELRTLPAVASFDVVDEAVLTDAEAERYLQRNLDLLDWQAAAGSKSPHLSVKLTALTPRLDPIDPERSRQRAMKALRKLMPRVLELRACLTLDMEQAELKPLVLETFRELAATYLEPGWMPAIALQAYLPDTQKDLEQLIGFARSNRRRIGVRLVKGAYWDTELAIARQRCWPPPVFEDKAQTDTQYERLTDLLLDHADIVFPAIAGHNVRGLAYAIAGARIRGLPASAWEIQMLHGMAAPLAGAIAHSGVQLRMYLPVGDLISGIAYLVRRLMENMANTSVLRQTYAEGRDLHLLLAPPAASPAGEGRAPANGFVNMPQLDFSRHDLCAGFAHALDVVRGQLGRDHPLAIHGAASAGRFEPAINPADPTEMLGRVEAATEVHAEQAVANARAAFAEWRDVPTAQRVELCLRAAGIMLRRREELAVWQVLEVGKNWREADADVAEAIDYLRYYAREMAALDGWKPTATYPAEIDQLRYESCGVAAIIAPWNFPLALLTGMTAAALVAGNTAIMKPAGPARLVACQLLEILREAGFPPQVCQLLPGNGETVGRRLVEHYDVAIVAFTGSRDVGATILKQTAGLCLGQRQLKRVACEMGGKNAIIVDSDADFDEAVPQTLQSAFGYQGQKCSAASRVIVVGNRHDLFVKRLAEALHAYSYGPPEDPQHVFGPVISAMARQKIESYVEVGRIEGRLFYRGKVPDLGFYVAPAIFTGIEPHHRLAREEIFGPVLAVLRAASFEQALEMALDSDYALTGGVFSRLPAHIELARKRFRVGNLYINRRITGALVAAQPFGGIGHSGTGIQAGGPDYLKQFLWTRVVSENTLRHGYVP
ncbi:MAG: bifunctional proline dehydrogenase/L-glutamate gamma-semialdehyde dehydrogenase [Betaproteobacteria bacterium]|nr:bifunctional proline dehydrogenase/L-glutamate gamma-semialdehyde dehydrogenase [Betaproteobacteria bacterium]